MRDVGVDDMCRLGGRASRDMLKMWVDIAADGAVVVATLDEDGVAVVQLRRC